MKKPIVYFKSTPTQYCRISVGGKVKKEGKGASGFVMPFRTNIELLDTGIIEESFSFVEVTNDKQQVTIQGSFSYQVNEPEVVLEQHNLAVDPVSKAYIADEQPEIGEQLIHVIKGQAREIVQGEELENVLVMGEKLSNDVSTAVTGSKASKDLGLVVKSLYVTSITAEPAIAKALGAQYREQLLTTAQQAEYTRRAKAVKNEKEIEENEMKNKIDLEKQREELIGLQAKNAKAEGTYRAEVLGMELDTYKGMDAETLKAHALLKIGEQANRIENLNIAPDLFTSIKQYKG